MTLSTSVLPWVLLLAVALLTYVWRSLGTLLATRIAPEGPLFRWVSCVSYALLAGLIARMIVLPAGALVNVALAYRLIGVALALLVFFWTGRNLLLGIITGLAAFAGLVYYG